MDATRASETTSMKTDTTVERTSERELVVTRTINGPARIVFDAWTRPELLQRWWAPKSFPVTLLSYEDSTFDFFGRYLEVTPHSRLAWTNDEADTGETITTVTFEEIDGRTQLVVHDLYPSAEALDAAIASGSTSGMPESLDQLDELLVDLGASA